MAVTNKYAAGQSGSKIAYHIGIVEQIRLQKVDSQ